MIDLLSTIKKTVDERRVIAKLGPVQIEIFKVRYDPIIKKGLAKNPLPISRGQSEKPCLHTWHLLASAGQAGKATAGA
jgi:hypothetical protein